MDHKRNSTAKMRFACAIIFLVFAYTFLACYQADILAVAQHVLSEGKTDYFYTLAPLLVTFVCFLLQLGAYAVTRVKRRFHGLTYFPSFLLLALIADVPIHVDAGVSLGWWWLALPFCLLCWAGVMWVARQLEPLEQEPHSFGWFSRYSWVNISQLVVMMLAVIFITNNDRLFHERMKMEHLMKEKQYEKALEVGEKSLQTDSSLTMLRIACLYRTGELGSRLFSYPLVGGSQSMYINGTSVKALMWQAPVWMYGTSPWMKKHRLKYRLSKEYELCALLLDKKLDEFVRKLVKYHELTKLPTHYKEALLLYCHLRTHPIVEFHDNVMDADFSDYQSMERKYSNPVERQSVLRDTYSNTYWYYYDYGNK